MKIRRILKRTEATKNTKRLNIRCVHEISNKIGTSIDFEMQLNEKYRSSFKSRYYCNCFGKNKPCISYGYSYRSGALGALHTANRLKTVNCSDKPKDKDKFKTMDEAKTSLQKAFSPGRNRVQIEKNVKKRKICCEDKYNVGFGKA